MLCRLDSAIRSPRHPSFTTFVLEPLAERHFDGEPGRDLSTELFHTVHPWAESVAAAQSCGLHANADRNEIVSQVLRLTWESCLRIDWTRYAMWPVFLETKVGRARIEAARSDDWLSRRERVRRRRFQGELACREQLEQRTLTGVERRAVAQAIAPSTSRVDWTAALMESRYPSTDADVAEPALAAAGSPITVEDEVEGTELGSIRRRCLSEWLGIVDASNHELAADLCKWSHRNESPGRDLPVRLAHRLEPYTPLLLAMLGDAA